MIVVNILLIATASFLDFKFAHRYLIPVLVLPVFGTVFTIVLLSPVRFNYIYKLFIIPILFIFIIYGIRTIKATPVELINYRKPLAVCLDAHVDKYGLKYGLSDYWNAKPLTLFSKRALRVNQTGKTLGTAYWINNYYWYFGKDKSPEYNFIITDRLDRKLILKKYGSPAHTLYCAGSEIFIYNRVEDAAFHNFFGIKRENMRLWQIMTGR